MSLIHRLGVPLIDQRACRLRRIEQSSDVIEQVRLIGPSEEEVIAASDADLGTEVTLAIEGATSEHPTVLIGLGNENRRDCQFGLVLLGGTGDRRLGHGHAVSMADGTKGVNVCVRTGPKREPSSVRFPIQGNPLGTMERRFSGRGVGECLGEGGRASGRIKPPQELLDGRPMGCRARLNAELGQELKRLVRGPLSDRRHESMIGEDGRQRQLRRRRRAAPVRPARVGNGCKRDYPTERIDTLHVTLLVHTAGHEIPSAEYGESFGPAAHPLRA